MLSCRFDRELSVRLVRPLMHLSGGGQKRRIPILMYHGISRDVAGGEPGAKVHVTPRLFAEQMRYLHQAGYRTIDIAGALGELKTGPIPSRTVVITFDDGYRDFYTLAFPILNSCGFSASVFLISSLVADTAKAHGSERYMSWSEVREIHSHGIRIGSHSATHPILNHLSAKQIDAELEISKRYIEQRLGCSVRSFSYPYSFPEHDHSFVRYVCAQLEGVGYENAVTTIIGSTGPGSDRFLLPRLPINALDDLELFKAKLDGAYDWLHIAQSARKRLMRSDRSQSSALNPHS